MLCRVFTTHVRGKHGNFSPDWMFSGRSPFRSISQTLATYGAHLTLKTPPGSTQRTKKKPDTVNGMQNHKVVYWCCSRKKSQDFIKENNFSNASSVKHLVLPRPYHTWSLWYTDLKLQTSNHENIPEANPRPFTPGLFPPVTMTHHPFPRLVVSWNSLSSCTRAPGVWFPTGSRSSWWPAGVVEVGDACCG